jgi:chromosome segregation ATPase
VSLDLESIAELGIIILDLSNKAKSIVSLANDEARDVLSSAHSELRDIKARYSSLISDVTRLEKNISELSSSESRLRESNKLLEDEARELLLTQNDLRVKIGLLQEEQRTIENDSNKAIKELDTIVASKKDELEALIQQIEHYKSVVDGPLKLLEKEESDIEQKRKDIQIYEFRIRNAYRELFPGREMRI